jgi:hypothetical protein
MCCADPLSRHPKNGHRGIGPNEDKVAGWLGFRLPFARREPGYIDSEMIFPAREHSPIFSAAFGETELLPLQLTARGR